MGGQYDHWADETGVRYQYPNTYRNRIQSGRPFIYYRGVRRKGGVRGVAEYFGTGFIGEVWRDPEIPESAPKRTWRWFCAIEDYQAFTPVPAKQNGVLFENISNPLGWRTGVREMPWDTFHNILLTAGLGAVIDEPEIDVEMSTDLEFVHDVSELMIERNPGAGKASFSEGLRRSVDSQLIGDTAEQIVYDWLKDCLVGSELESLDWPAQRKESPGWDINYIDTGGEIVAFEVKGTKLNKFASIQVTANEWKSAQLLGDRYNLALVTKVLTPNLRLGLIANPSGEVEHGSLDAKPSGWVIKKLATP